MAKLKIFYLLTLSFFVTLAVTQGSAQASGSLKTTCTAIDSNGKSYSATSWNGGRQRLQREAMERCEKNGVKPCRFHRCIDYNIPR